MKFQQYIPSLFLSISTAFIPVLGQETPKLNFLFIAVDDLKPLMGCYGDTLAHTPNMDEIAGKGVTFTMNFCQQALCAPSRTSLMTSRYPDQTRVWDLETLMREMDPGIVTLPEYLIHYGYRTTATGKIFDSRSVDQGRDIPSWSTPWKSPWDASYYNAETGKPAYFYADQHAKDTIALLQAEAIQLGVDQKSYVMEKYFPAFENADVPVDAYVDGAIANIGVELLEQAAASGDPFFLGIGFHRPHLPFNAPKQFWDLYQRNDFALASFQGKAAGTPDIAYHSYGELRSYTGIPESGNVPDETQLELIHGYYAATSYIDQLIGQVMAKVRELGLENNTAVVLWGDHGWHLGDHQLWCKHSNFEQATRAPLIISYPGQPNRGAHCETPTEFTDVAPTLCDLAGIPVPGFFEGESLIPLIQDTLGMVREGSLSQYPRHGKMGYSLRTIRYRYTRWTNSDGSYYASELYDYELDPLETVNFAFDPGYVDIRNRLDSLVLERIVIPSTQERIYFEIKGRGTVTQSKRDTISITGASITLGQETKLTDEFGLSMFTRDTGWVDVYIDAVGYVPYSDSIHVGEDNQVKVVLQQEEPVYEVSVSVEDYYSGVGLVGARVTLHEIEKLTDSNGVAVYTLEKGEYALSLKRNNYPDSSGMVYIRADTVLRFKLKATRAWVKVWVKEGNAPLNFATVSLNELTVISNSLGLSRFDTLSTGLSYDYKIEKEGFQMTEGNLFLVADTGLHIRMERITGSKSVAGNTGLKIWPNPARDILYCSTENGKEGGRVEITDAYGCIVLQHDTNRRLSILHIESLEPGLYWIRFVSRQSSIPMEFLKFY